jgi:hypothetical protein
MPATPSSTPSVRVVVAALIGQAVLLGGLILVLVHGFGGGDEDADRRDPAAIPALASVPVPKVDRFDAVRALREARYEVGLGPRPAGSAASRRLAAHLRARIPRGRFEDLGPAHPGLRNVVGHLPGRRPAILVGAHYDTEAVIPGHVGANDGAAGTAVVVELARALARMPRPARAREVGFVLFDGEEEPHETDDFYRDALRGSKAYAAAHAKELRSMILLDYVGNAGIRLPREGHSDRRLWARLRDSARAVGTVRVFPAGNGPSIVDDHVPFLFARVAAIDLIDFSYRWRDTPQDTLDKLSVRSLDAVGETVTELLRRLRRG